MADIDQIRLTVKDYLELVGEDHDGIVELINGEIVSHSPRDTHQSAVGSIYIVLRTLLGGHKVYLVRMDVQLDDENFVEPDVFYVGGDDSPCKLGDDGFYHGAPALIVEVISPSSIKRDRLDKFELYQRHGVREYWIVEPEAQIIEVNTLENGAYRRVGVFAVGQSFTSPLLGTTFEVSTLLNS